MQEKQQRKTDPSPDQATPAPPEKKVPAPDIIRRNAASSTAPSVMKHIPSGGGAASQRSAQGGKAGGGMGGHQAGGIKGGGKQKTHAGRK